MELAGRVPSMEKPLRESRKLSSVASRVPLFSQRLCRYRLGAGRVSPSFRPLCAATERSRQSISKKRQSEAPRLYHRVEEGDTLFSIAKQYKTTMRSIALANDVANIDILRAGQVLLVPILPGGFSRVRAVISDVREPLSQSVRSATAEAGRRAQVAPVLGLAKFAVPVLLLAPILGFCVRCIVDRVRARGEEAVQEKLVDEAKWEAYHRDQLTSWKGRMAELKASEPPPLALASGGMVEAEQEDEVQLSSEGEEEELFESYAELEASYRKFLVDSGLADSGYRRHTSTR